MGSEMCIRDRVNTIGKEVLVERIPVGCAGCGIQHIEPGAPRQIEVQRVEGCTCLLYTSDAADERSSVDLGGRRIIKKKKRADIALSVCVTT